MPTETLQDRVEFYDRLIPQVFSNRFPEGFRLMPLDWALAADVIERPEIEATIDDKIILIRPIGTMDVEFLDNHIVGLARQGEVDLATNYPCGLKCPGCFSEEDVYGDSKRLMTWQQVMRVIDDAREIGLRSIKFLGPGELFQNRDLFDILNATSDRGLPISIFTKGAELGDDVLARQMYGHLGVENALDLVARVAQYDNVRILLGFNSFFPERQDLMVGSYHKTGNYTVVDGRFENRGVVDYTTKRDRALKYLVEAGFNAPEKGQRLTLIAAPVRLDQIDEVPDMYVWAARRNIPLVIAPTMESGPKAIGLMRHDKKLDPQHERLIDFYVAVYSGAIEEGIMSLAQLREEGVSAYMGTSPCNQVANGLFLRLNGQVQICPGRSDVTVIYGNVHNSPIARIWLESRNYQMGALTNNWCAAKTEGMPLEVQQVVFTKIEGKYR